MPHNVRNQTCYVTTGDPETVDDHVMYAPGQLGCRVTLKQPGPPGSPGVEHYRDKTYQYVRLDSTMAVAPARGSVMWWADRARYLVTTDPTGRRGQIAGVYQRLGGPEFLDNYCYIQVQGPAIVQYIAQPTAAPDTTGLFVIPSAVAGSADCLAAGVAATYPPLGTSMSAVNPANQGIVNLNIDPETP